MGGYFHGLYERTMREAYAHARREIALAIRSGGACLECGAHDGHEYEWLKRELGGAEFDYRGVEWNPDMVHRAKSRGLEVVQGDLNREMAFDTDSLRCVFALSVLEHLLNPCRFMDECFRILEPGGSLILLTPNISTYFTAALILAGKMPSSGPHPDSTRLLNAQAPIKPTEELADFDIESDTPVHRHLVVFSFRALKHYLQMAGFSEIRGYGYGLYPFPNFMQPLMEEIDPYHCHQMVFVARK
jgi:SAM-dependent methyltransferase